MDNYIDEKKDKDVRRFEKFVVVVVIVVVVVVVDEGTRNVLGLGINCFNRTNSSILCASRRVNVTRRIQTTRRKIATMVIIRERNFFRRSLIVELIFNRYV